MKKVAAGSDKLAAARAKEKLRILNSVSTTHKVKQYAAGTAVGLGAGAIAGVTIDEVYVLPMIELELLLTIVGSVARMPCTNLRQRTLLRRPKARSQLSRGALLARGSTRKP